jgi:hypothetical protein
MASGLASGVIRSADDNQVEFRAYVAIGASGAATVSNGNATYITCVKNTTGVYDITFPPFAASATSLCTIKVNIALSVTPTVSQATVIAFSPTAGTAQIKTALNAAATGVEPASGDALEIIVRGAKTGIF